MSEIRMPYKIRDISFEEDRNNTPIAGKTYWPVPMRLNLNKRQRLNLLNELARTLQSDQDVRGEVTRQFCFWGDVVYETNGELG